MTKDQEVGMRNKERAEKAIKSAVEPAHGRTLLESPLGKDLLTSIESALNTAQEEMRSRAANMAKHLYKAISDNDEISEAEKARDFKLMEIYENSIRALKVDE